MFLSLKATEGAEKAAAARYTDMFVDAMREAKSSWMIRWDSEFNRLQF